MNCLGIESTAHTFAAGMIDSEGSIHSNAKDIMDSPFAIHPRKAAEHHAQVAARIIKQAMIKKPDLIAYSAGPGLGPCLRIGAVVARTIANKLKIPLIGVNHCVGHLEIARLTTKFDDPVFLYLSGANSQVLSHVNGKYRILGETLDVGLGSGLNKFARAAGLKGAPEIEVKALKGKELLDLPYTVKGMDFSFAGLITHCTNLIGKKRLEDVCYSLQEYAFAMVTEVAERALAALDKDKIVLTGGVAANKRLKNMLETMAKERGASFSVVPKEYAGDNGVMIALTGLLMHEHGVPGKEKIDQKWRPDQTPIPWIGTK